MICAEVSIIPIGTNSTSVSDYIAESEKVLQNYTSIKYKLNAMSTEIEADNIDTLFEVLKEMHLAQIENGAQRVSTSVRIDDRRDKKITLSGKVKAVEAKL